MARCDSVTLPAELDPNRENHPLPRHKFQSLPTASELAPLSSLDRMLRSAPRRARSFQMRTAAVSRQR
jgi:hypothetical protein